MRNKAAKFDCTHRQNILRTIWLAFLVGNFSGKSRSINRYVIVLHTIARTEKSRKFSLTRESYFSIKWEIISLYLNFCLFDLYLFGGYKQLVDKKQNKTKQKNNKTWKSHYFSWCHHLQIPFLELNIAGEPKGHYRHLS